MTNQLTSNMKRMFVIYGQGKSEDKGGARRIENFEE